MNALKADVSGQSVSFWTTEAVEARLAEAARTLQALSDDKPRDSRAQWPGEILQDFWGMWNQLTDLERRQRAAEFNRVRTLPTSAQISRLDECLSWLYGNPLWTARTRSLVWGVALGHSWRSIALEVGRDPKTVKADHPRAIARLVAWLNA